MFMLLCGIFNFVSKDYFAKHRVQNPKFYHVCTYTTIKKDTDKSDKTQQGSNKGEMLQVLYEQWVQAGGNWNNSQLVAQAKTTISGSKTGARRWMLRSQIIEKYGSESIADELILSKETDPALKKTQVREHPELPHRQDLKLYLCWDESYETDKEDTLITQMLEVAQSGGSGGNRRGRSKEKKDRKEKHKKGKDKKRKRSTSSSKSSSRSSSASSTSLSSGTSVWTAKSAKGKSKRKVNKTVGKPKPPKPSSSSADGDKPGASLSKKAIEKQKKAEKEAERKQKKEAEQAEKKKQKEEESQRKKAEKEEELKRKKAEKEAKTQVEKEKQKTRAAGKKAISV